MRQQVAGGEGPIHQIQRNRSLVFYQPATRVEATDSRLPRAFTGGQEFRRKG